MKSFIFLIGFMALLTDSRAGLIEATPEQRAESFAPYTDLKIDGTPVKKFLGQRMAVLLQADEVKVTQTAENSIDFKFLKPPMGAGSATAIDARGYYLTAAHCIHDIPPLVMLHTPKDGMQVVRSRVVWVGQESKGEPDLALIHVPFTLGFAFAWTLESTVSEKIIAEGYCLAPPPGFNLTTLSSAGKILKISAKQKGPFPFSSILHDAPIAFGNSGGPAMDLDGKLVGINVLLNGDFRLLKFAYDQKGGTALRPDSPWLKTLIDQDQAKLTLKKTQTHP